MNQPRGGVRAWPITFAWLGYAGCCAALVFGVREGLVTPAVWAVASLALFASTMRP